MRYPEFCKTVIDVTKAPYFADNTGKTDCTKALCAAIDDCMRPYIEGVEKVKRKLIELHEKYGGNVYVGAEAGKYISGEIYVTLPEEIPQVMSLFLPKGTYLVSDTVCYSFDNLSARQTSWYTCELNRFIQLFGESREETIIKLADHSAGFEKGSKKPVISFNRSHKEDFETTNCAQMNTIENLTIDCGEGNEGAVGLLYASSNCGRIEELTIRAKGGFCGIDYDFGSEACVREIRIEGFDYGMRTDASSPLVMDNIDLRGNKIAGILTKNAHLICADVVCPEIPLFSFLPGKDGRYYCAGFEPDYIGELNGSYLYSDVGDERAMPNKLPPKNTKFENPDSWAFVDDFGAVADGVTDCTVAIQNAMNSGKETIVFGLGNYKIERTIKIPASVKTIDCRYTCLVPSMSLIIGEIESMFELCEDSDEPFFIEHVNFLETGAGFYRLLKHACKRTVVFKDVTMLNPVYFNTVEGSEVYFDNCFVGTTHYSQDACLHRDGYIPVFCRALPVEVHGQKLYGKVLNIERADIELYSDHSQIVIDGYKVEGPGTLLKSVNGGVSDIHLINAAWWGNRDPDHALYELHDSSARLVGGYVFFYPGDENLCLALREFKQGVESRTYLKDSSEQITGIGRLMGKVVVG